MLGQPSVNVGPWLNVKPVSVVVGELTHERKEGVVELGCEGRTLAQACIKVAQVSGSQRAMLLFVDLLSAVLVLVAVQVELEFLIVACHPVRFLLVEVPIQHVLHDLKALLDDRTVGQQKHRHRALG